MNILAVFPYKPSSSTRVRSFEVLSVLVSLGSVTVAFPSSLSDVPDDCDRILANCTVLPISDSRFRRFLRVLQAFTKGKSISFAFYRNPFSAVSFDPEQRFDMIFVERLSIPRSARNLSSFIVYDAVDSFMHQTRFLSRNASFLKKLAYSYDQRVIAAEQVLACNFANSVICTTNLEKKRLLALGVTSPVHPFLHRSQVYSVRESSKLDGVDLQFIFHGRASYSANAEAGTFIRQIIAPNLPDFDFCIFGAGWKPEESRNVRVLGYQEDLSLLGSATCAIFPLATAVGIQNKVIEALCAGLPCIVTPLVAEGIPSKLFEVAGSFLHVVPRESFVEYLRDRGRELYRSDAFADCFREEYEKIVSQERRWFVDLLLGRKLV